MIMKMDTFRRRFIDHKDFASGNTFVSVYNDFEQSQY